MLIDCTLILFFHQFSPCSNGVEKDVQLPSSLYRKTGRSGFKAKCQFGPDYSRHPCTNLIRGPAKAVSLSALSIQTVLFAIRIEGQSAPFERVMGLCAKHTY